MTDFFDRAAEEELHQRQEALARHHANTQAQQGTEDCVDCGNGIPAARRAAYPQANRCVPCQTAVERRESHRLAKSR